MSALDAIFKGEGDYGIEKDDRPKTDDPNKIDTDNTMTLPVI